MKKLYVTIEVWQKGNLYLASSPELDFISQGNTFEEAKKNLLEVIKIQFEEMTEMGTLDEYLSECGFIVEGDRIIPQREIMGFEKSVVMVT
jgi:predicted RNase H-like HicB family nuclease